MNSRRLDYVHWRRKRPSNQHIILLSIQTVLLKAPVQIVFHNPLTVGDLIPFCLFTCLFLMQNNWCESHIIKFVKTITFNCMHMHLIHLNVSIKITLWLLLIQKSSHNLPNSLSKYLKESSTLSDFMYHL